MSYGFTTMCWACKFGAYHGGDNSCKDQEKIQAGINSVYANPEEHKGAGTVLMSCSRLQVK